MAASSSNAPTLIKGIDAVIKLVESGKPATLKALLKGRTIDLGSIKKVVDDDTPLLFYAVGLFYKEKEKKKKKDRRLHVVKLLLEHGTNKGVVAKYHTVIVDRLYPADRRNQRDPSRLKTHTTTVEPSILLDTIAQLLKADLVEDKERRIRLVGQSSAYPEIVDYADADLMLLTLIYGGIDIDEQLGVHWAILSHNGTILKLVLQKGGSLTTRDQQTNTPLMLAIQTHWIEGIKILLAYGAEVTNEAMKVADRHATTEIVELLKAPSRKPSGLQALALKAGANPSEVLSADSAAGVRRRAAELNLESLGLKESQIRSFLSAIKRGDAASVQTSIQSTPALLDVRTGTGKTVSQYAESLGHDHIVSILNK